MTDTVVVSERYIPDPVILEKAKELVDKYKPYEVESGIPLLLLFDHKSGAFYTICHLRADIIVSKSDVDATLEPDESEDYKLNREIYTDNYAFHLSNNDT